MTFGRGTYAAPTQVVTGDRVGGIQFLSMPGSTGNTAIFLMSCY